MLETRKNLFQIYIDKDWSCICKPYLCKESIRYKQYIQVTHPEPIKFVSQFNRWYQNTNNLCFHWNMFVHVPWCLYHNEWLNMISKFGESTIWCLAITSSKCIKNSPLMIKQFIFFCCSHFDDYGIGCCLFASSLHFDNLEDTKIKIYLSNRGSCNNNYNQFVCYHLCINKADVLVSQKY